MNPKPSENGSKDSKAKDGPRITHVNSISLPKAMPSAQEEGWLIDFTNTKAGSAARYQDSRSHRHQVKVLITFIVRLSCTRHNLVCQNLICFVKSSIINYHL